MINMLTTEPPICVKTEVIFFFKSVQHLYNKGVKEME
jgi:hypothetical protein